MFVTSLLCGMTLLIIGIMMWRFKLANILAGFDKTRVKNPDRLAVMVGLTLALSGLLLLIESFLIYKNIIVNNAMAVVLISLIIGIMVTGLVASYFSKHY